MRSPSRISLARTRVVQRPSGVGCRGGVPRGQTACRTSCVCAESVDAEGAKPGSSGVHAAAIEEPDAPRVRGGEEEGADGETRRTRREERFLLAPGRAGARAHRAHRARTRGTEHASVAVTPSRTRPPVHHQRPRGNADEQRRLRRPRALSPQEHVLQLVRPGPEERPLPEARHRSCGCAEWGGREPPRSRGNRCELRLRQERDVVAGHARGIETSSPDLRGARRVVDTHGGDAGPEHEIEHALELLAGARSLRRRAASIAA